MCYGVGIRNGVFWGKRFPRDGSDGVWWGKPLMLCFVYRIRGGVEGVDMEYEEIWSVWLFFVLVPVPVLCCWMWWLRVGIWYRAYSWTNTHCVFDLADLRLRDFDTGISAVPFRRMSMMLDRDRDMIDPHSFHNVLCKLIYLAIDIQTPLHKRTYILRF